MRRLWIGLLLVVLAAGSLGVSDGNPGTLTAKDEAVLDVVCPQWIAWHDLPADTSNWDCLLDIGITRAAEMATTLRVESYSKQERQKEKTSIDRPVMPGR